VILTEEQFNKPLMECGDRPMLKLYVLTLGEAGLRCDSEALWLRWDDVRLEEGSVRVTSGQNGHRSKGGKSRFVPMTPRLLAAMREHFARFRLASSTPWLFHREHTRRHHEAGARIKSLDSGFRAAVKRARLPGELHPQDLRRRRVTEWLAAGKSPVAVMHAMGHSDLKTAMSYNRFVPEHLRTLVESTPTLQRREAAISG
jgi:integrase/recombinase XerD